MKEGFLRIKDISGKKEHVKQEYNCWEEFFAIYSGGRAKLFLKKNTSSSLAVEGNKDTVISIGEEEYLSQILSDAWHMKDTLQIEDLLQLPGLEKVFNLPFVAENFVVLRKAQIDWHATRWFNKDVLGAHASEFRLRPGIERTVQACPVGVANVVYDVNLALKLDPVAETAIRLCYHDIIHSRESDDKFEPLRVAIAIGKVIRDLIESISPFEEAQKLQEDQNTRSVEIKIGEALGSDEEQVKPRHEKKVAVLGAGEEEVNDQVNDELMDRLERAKEKYDDLRQSKPWDGKHPLSPFTVPLEGEAVGSHDYRVDNLNMVGDIELSASLKRMAGDIAGSDITVRRARSGAVTPKAWKINFGEVRIFTRPPFILKQVVVLVDLSDSMGCWCKTCCERSGFEEGKSKAWMALQAATAIGRTFPETTEIFGFSSDNQNTYIYPLKIGKEPMCRRLSPIGMGTPLCVALKRLEEVSMSLDATVAVLITDGDPGTPAPLSSEHMRTHTQMLSEDLYLRGLRYCTVMIGAEMREQLFPSETMVRIRLPSDLYKLQEVLIKLTQRQD
jgi:hypothetical protein